MKKLLILILIATISSCTAMKKFSSVPEEEELYITRKYVGVFVEYRHTGPEDLNGPNIIWIKTSLESIYGKISAQGKKCEFREGDRLYLRRTFYNPGVVSGYWIYHIENDSSVSYRATEFQHDRQVLIDTWF
jgi:hypothetical protein